MASPSRGPGACSAGSAASGTGSSASIASTLRTATTWCGWRPTTAGLVCRPTGRPSSSSGSRAASLYSTGPETPDDACRSGLGGKRMGFATVEDEVTDGVAGVGLRRPQKDKADSVEVRGGLPVPGGEAYPDGAGP